MTCQHHHSPSAWLTSSNRTSGPNAASNTARTSGTLTKSAMQKRGSWPRPAGWKQKGNAGRLGTSSYKSISIRRCPQPRPAGRGRPQPVALVCFLGGLPVRKQIRVELGGVGRHLRFPPSGDHVVDGVGLHVAEFDHLVDIEAGHDGVVQNQEHLDRVGRASG